MRLHGMIYLQTKKIVRVQFESQVRQPQQQVEKLQAQQEEELQPELPGATGVVTAEQVQQLVQAELKKTAAEMVTSERVQLLVQAGMKKARKLPLPRPSNRGSDNSGTDNGEQAASDIQAASNGAEQAAEAAAATQAVAARADETARSCSTGS